METIAIHRSKTRKKSCSKCVKAKRRCDLLLPTCSRCLDKGFDCVYVDRTSNDQSTKSTQRPKSNSASQSKGFITKPCGNSDCANRTNDIAKTTNHSMLNIPEVGFHTPELDFLASWSSTDSISPPFAEDLLFPDVYPLFTGFSSPTLPSPYSSIQATPQIVMRPLQITYLISQIKSFVSTFATHSHASFIHPLSYSDPSTLPTAYTDVLSVCALYTVKSPQTFSILESKLSQLITTSKSSYFSAQDWLLAVQALILYQIIRLLDGDDKQNRNAERQLPLLLEWTDKLQEEYIVLLNSGLDLNGRDVPFLPTERCFDYYILMESIRRTVMISTFLQCMHKTLQDGYVGAWLPRLAQLPVNVGAAKLWEAARTTERKDLASFCTLEARLQVAEVYTYVNWAEGWGAGIVPAGEGDEELYERLLLVACWQRGGMETKLKQWTEACESSSSGEEW